MELSISAVHRQMLSLLYISRPKRGQCQRGLKRERTGGGIEGMMEVTVRSVHSSLRKTCSITMHSSTKKCNKNQSFIMMMGEKMFLTHAPTPFPLPLSLCPSLCKNKPIRPTMVGKVIASKAYQRPKIHMIH